MEIIPTVAHKLYAQFLSAALLPPRKRSAQAYWNDREMAVNQALKRFYLTLPKILVIGSKVFIGRKISALGILERRFAIGPVSPGC